MSKSYGRWESSRRRGNTTIPTERPDISKVMSKFDSVDAVTERAAVSVIKFAGWIAALAVVLYGLWKSL